MIGTKRFGIGLVAVAAALAGAGCSKLGDAINAATGKGSSSATAATTGSPTTSTSTSTTGSNTATTLAAAGSAIKISIPKQNALNAATDNPTTGTFSHTQTVDANGTASATATYQANNGKVVGPLNRGASNAATAAVQEYIDPSAGPNVDAGMIVSRDAGAARLTDVSYGLAYNLDPTTNSGAISGFHFGNPTAASSMPTTTATYAGTWRGVALQNGGNTQVNGGLTPLQGDATMSANFGAGTVSGSVTNLQDKTNGGFFNSAAGPAVGFGMTFNGNIDQSTKNTFNGTVGLTNARGSTAAFCILDTWPSRRTLRTP